MQPLAFRWALAFGLFGLVSASAWASGPPTPAKIDAGIVFRFDVQFGPQAMVPRAPWYTYFPADPNVAAAMQPQSTPFPPWPGALPAAPPMPRASAPGSNIQPAGFQAPSYWYGQ